MISLIVFVILPRVNQLVVNDPRKLLPAICFVRIPRQPNRDLFTSAIIQILASRALHPRGPRDCFDRDLRKVLGSDLDSVGYCTLAKSLFRLWRVVTTHLILAALSRR